MTWLRRHYEENNRTLVVCSSCGSHCKNLLPWWWMVGSCFVFSVVLLFVIFRANPPGLGLYVGALVVIEIPWQMAVTRIYHGVWRRRHPLRCRGGGEPEPVPTRS